MDTGSLNRRVAIESRSSVVDSIGQPVEAWTTLATVWASIAFVSGIETIKGNAEISTAKASIRIRYRDDVTSGMRAKFKADVYDIEAVLPDIATRQYVDLVCKRVE